MTTTSSTVKLLFSINLASVVLKFISTTGTSAMSVLLDMLNDVGDAVGLGLLLAGLRLSKKDDDVEYPYGTRRALYVTGLVFMVLVLLLLLLVAVYKTISLLQEGGVVTTRSYAIYTFTLALSLNVYGLYKVLSTRSSNSPDPAFTSAFIDAFSDTLGSVLALVAMITGSQLVDVVGSLGIVLVIAISAVTISHRYFHILIGRSPPKKVLKRTLDAVLSIPEVKDVNVFKAVMLTEEEYMLVLEVEVRKDMSVEDLEKLSAMIEESVKRVEPRFKHVVVEFVKDRGDKTYKSIISKVDRLAD